ncbi:MAG: hypothetical protein OEU56_21135 [Rhodospirillales bacterium]|nr:hypothetical protein [Rhodospirillales bacterium]MDH3969527.1 hypothetical protein [Rhodospirillales bacterium]
MHSKNFFYINSLAAIRSAISTKKLFVFKDLRRGGEGRQVRSALYMAALSAGRFNPKLAAFRERLLAKGMAKKAAIIVVARRLLTILNALVRSGQNWNPEHP